MIIKVFFLALLFHFSVESTLYASMFGFGIGNTDTFSTVEIDPLTGNVTMIAENVAIDGNLYTFDGISAFDQVNSIYYYVLDLLSVEGPPMIYSTTVTTTAAGPAFEVEWVDFILSITATNAQSSNSELLFLYTNNLDQGIIADLYFPEGSVDNIMGLPDSFSFVPSDSVSAYYDLATSYYYLIVPDLGNITDNWVMVADLENLVVKDFKMLYGCYDINVEYISYDQPSGLFVGGALSPSLPYSFYVKINATTGECKQTVIKAISSTDVLTCWTFDPSTGNLYYYIIPQSGDFWLGYVNVRTGSEGKPVPMGVYEITSMEIAND